MELSIVTTLYRSAPHLSEFYGRIRKEAEKITSDYEIILVNDGSPDNSLDIAVSIQQKDPKVTVVDLSRNFGHHKAMMTGLSYTRGRKVFLIDCDLEEEPELLGHFYVKFMEEKACDVVYGVQKKRKGGIFEKVSGNLFYYMVNLLSNTKMPSNVVTARLMSKRYVNSLLMHRENELFLAGLWHITGYVQLPFYITKQSKGTTSYTFAKKISVLINAVTSFSNKPLLYIFYLGSVISFIAAVYIFTLVIRKLFFGISVGGWTSLIVSVWFLGGLTIFSLGVIGIYLSKIFIETKNRPYTIVRDLYRDAKENDT